MPLKHNDESKFWSHVTKLDEADGGCWIWTGLGRDNNGYGQWVHRMQRWKAHRFAWHITCGPIPEGLSVLHRCDTPECVRPDHLALGTQPDNMRDMHKKGRWVRVPSRGTAAHQSKLTDADVVLIRRRAAVGVSFSSMARMYGVTRPAIASIVYRRTWTHIQ